MSLNSNNIVVGAARIYINGIEAGHTQGGVSFRKDNQFVDVDSDQAAGVARKVQTYERAFLSTTMLEVTLANMHKVMNEIAGNLSGSVLQIGSNAPAAQEYVVTVVGKGANGKVRTFTAYRSISSESAEYMIGSRDAASVLPVTFELLKDDNHNQQFGFFVDTDT